MWALRISGAVFAPLDKEAASAAMLSKWDWILFTGQMTGCRGCAGRNRQTRRRPNPSACCASRLHKSDAIVSGHRKSQLSRCSNPDAGTELSRWPPFAETRSRKHLAPEGPWEGEIAVVLNAAVLDARDPYVAMTCSSDSFHQPLFTITCFNCVTREQVRKMS